MITRRRLLTSAGALAPAFIATSSKAQIWTALNSVFGIRPAQGAVYFDNGADGLPASLTNGPPGTPFGNLQPGQLNHLGGDSPWSMFSLFIKPRNQSFRIASWFDVLTGQEVKSIEILPPGFYPTGVNQQRTGYSLSKFGTAVLHVAAASHVGRIARFVNWYLPLADWIFEDLFTLLTVHINPYDRPLGSSPFEMFATVTPRGGSTFMLNTQYGPSDKGPVFLPEVFEIPWGSSAQGERQVTMSIGFPPPAHGGIPTYGDITANGLIGTVEGILWEPNYPISPASLVSQFVGSSGGFVPPPLDAKGFLVPASLYGYGPPIPPVYLSGGLGHFGFGFNGGPYSAEPDRIDSLVMEPMFVTPSGYNDLGPADDSPYD